MQPDPSWYSVDYFRRNGFERKRCSVGGEWFWTLDPSRTTCGDAPCVDYEFLDRSFTSAKFSLKEVRERFLKYFTDRGHTAIPPRSVAARWRNDLYLTIASIVLFQPYVTSGEVPPPANPLVVSQPCIRLPDIDNVGLTAGRHITIFEMGGHHAFNSADKKLYWKDETVGYCFDFYEKILGVKPDQVTLKESVWVGGGNAGPCFEVAIGGLEVATLVFMEYAVGPGDTWSPLPLKIVDTGYGIERMTWVSTQAPTAFHAIYGGLLDKFCDLLGVQMPPDATLREVAKHSAVMNLEGAAGIAELRARVAKAVGTDAGSLEKTLSPVEALFGIIDHTKTLSFMLSDGIVPSNSGEGYLARLVLRRALRLRKKLSSQSPLDALIELQLRYWGEDFPRLRHMVDTVLEEARLEEERFAQTQLKAQSLVSASIPSWTAHGGPGLDELIDLYDSNGVDPDTVRELATGKGVEVNVPDNFFALVAQKHAYADHKREHMESFPGALLQQNPTRKLYYEDVSKLSFSARVLARSANMVVLDSTCFYPEGGGQPADQGVLEAGQSSVRVVDAQIRNNVVIHILEKPVDGLKEFSPGSTVNGSVDAERRLRHTQHHDATHILLASARAVLGEHVWQAGAQKGFSHSRLDITHFRKPSDEEVAEIEAVANRVVQENRRITVSYMSRTEAETKYGDSIYQGGAISGAQLRIVEVEHFDVEACGGTHSSNSGTVGLIKVLKVEQIQDGVTRFVFAAGKAALDHIRESEQVVGELSKMLHAEREKLVDRLSETLEQLRKQKQLAEKLEHALVDSILAGLTPKPSAFGDIVLIDLSAMADLNPSRVAAHAADKTGAIALAVSGSRLAAAAPRGKDVSGLIGLLRERSHAKGGGSKAYGELVASEGQVFDVSEIMGWVTSK
ncbi:MAG: alanine--tRNA ligase [Thermoprotei archaeon]